MPPTRSLGPPAPPTHPHTHPFAPYQAADLRYIMEAPKLELSPEEKVQIPVLDNLEAPKK